MKQGSVLMRYESAKDAGWRLQKYRIVEFYRSGKMSAKKLNIVDGREGYTTHYVDYPLYETEAEARKSFVNELDENIQRQKHNYDQAVERKATFIAGLEVNKETES